MTNQFFKTKIEETKKEDTSTDFSLGRAGGLEDAYEESQQAVKDWILKFKDKLRYYWDTDEHEELTGEIFEDIIDKSAKEDLGIDVEDKRKKQPIICLSCRKKKNPYYLNSNICKKCSKLMDKWLKDKK